MKRSKELSDLVDVVTGIHLDHPVRVGVDGVDASGKTILSDELALLIQSRGQDVIRISVDDFHNPRKIRYQQGRSSPQGFYDDSFNYSALISHLLEPLGPKGDLKRKLRELAMLLPLLGLISGCLFFGVVGSNFRLEICMYMNTIK